MASLSPVYNQFFTQDPAAFMASLAESREHLRLFGPQIHVAILPPSHMLAQLPASEHRSVTGTALVDTGASMTTIDESALKTLGVAPVNMTTVATPSGTAFQLLYPAELSFPGTVLPKSVFAEVLGSPHLMTQGLIALIGRDVISEGLLVYNGISGSFTLAF